MRSAFALTICLTTLALSLDVAATSPQAPGPGRIVGRVTDRLDSALPGVQMTLISEGARRSVATNDTGGFVFEGLDAGRSYTVRAELSGFKDGVREDVAVAASETVTVNFSLKVCRAGIGPVDSWVAPLFDRLLMADAVVHVRITEAGRMRLIETDESCYDVNDAPATILGVGRVRDDEWHPHVTIALTSNSVRLESGAEYLAFLTYNASTHQFWIAEESVRDLAGGRVNGLTELGIRDGTPIARALMQLNALYRRHTRYRQYDKLEPTASLDTLRNKTGWLVLGIRPADRDAWVDDNGRDVPPPFDFIENPKAPRTLPRAADRIRLKEGGPITILDYGSGGEALRNRSPTTRQSGLHVTDSTGTRADAGGVYLVAGVQLEPYGDLSQVWVRLVATR